MGPVAQRLFAYFEVPGKSTRDSAAVRCPSKASLGTGPSSLLWGIP